MAAYGTEAGPATMVELHISCRNLINLDVASKSDPMALVYTRPATDAPWTEVGRTEWQKDTLNPNFANAVKLRYTFEVTQFLRFAVYDMDCASADLSKQDFIGAVETTLASVVSCPTGTFSQELVEPAKPKSKRGHVVVVAEEVKECTAEVGFMLEGRNLDKKDLFGKSDPYLVISQGVGANLVKVHQTETIMNTLNPVWRPFALSVQKLCNADPNRRIVFDCYDWDRHSSPDHIGVCETTLRQIQESAGVFELVLNNPKKVGKKNYKGSGTLVFKRHEVVQVPTFLDYLRGGCEISMVCAIDFTGSNGDLRSPTSLHHISKAPNQYEMAIQSVGSILAYYDRDGMIPVYGYGGRMPDGQVSHCFALNGNPANPEVPGVQGILEAYHMAIQNIGLSGPTHFAPVIAQTAEIVKMNVQTPGQKYYILLIITDGAINDMAATVEQIVAAANSLPLSVVIVGVGSSPEFRNMAVLDGDEAGLKDRNGIAAIRDIVQFVPFSNFVACPQRLAEETLCEIPMQLVSFMRARGINPQPIMPMVVPQAEPAVAPPQ